MIGLRTLILVGFSLLVFGVLLVSAEDKHLPRGEPEPLVTIMRGLAKDMEHIQQGLWYENFDQIRVAARSIAKHPPVTPAERAAIQSVLGDDFGAFVASDRKTHDLALELAEIAKQRNIDQAVRKNAELQRSCVSCHTDYRERLQDRASDAR